MNSKGKLVSREEQAIEEIRSFQQQGYTLEEIYVIAHDSGTTNGLAKLMSTHTVGLPQEGLVNAFANLFRSRGDQLRVKLQSLGLTKDETDYFEKELDKGKILIMVWNDDIDFEDRDQQKNIYEETKGQSFLRRVFTQTEDPIPGAFGRLCHIKR